MTSGSSRKYIELLDSTGSGSAFRVVQGGFKPIKDKTGEINRTAGGGIDHAVGDIYQIFEYVIWCRDTEEDAGYGDRAELERIYALNNPNGTPSNVVTLKDHFNTEYDCLMVGQEVPQPLTTTISGLYAWFYIPVKLHVIPS
ncbi:MAG: hypothetical protein ACXABD_09650 [Candidatus Thorarchaeota archaeon]|jgi:hypothetical protein